MYIRRVLIKNFRTFDSLDEKGREPFELKFDECFQVIAGANNSGKTNLLRVLNLFFNSTTDNNEEYDRYRDIPYHKGKDGSASPINTEVEVDLFLSSEDVKKLSGFKGLIIHDNILRTKKIYKNDGEDWKYLHDNKEYKSIDKSHVIAKLFRRIKFVYLPSNVSIAEKVNELASEEILPTMIDSYGYGQSELGKKIKKLQEKLDEVDILTAEILSEKNKLITSKFRGAISSFPEIMAGMEVNDFSLEIELGDESIADILSKRVHLAIKDSSHITVESKGSGIQKLALITLLDYFSENNDIKARFTNPFLIWAIDEPETFLQPNLQKKLRQIFEKVSQTHQIIITTHSPKLIDINKLENVKLFYLDTRAIPYDRKEKKIFIKKTTKYYDFTEHDFSKRLKEHLGIESNDGWIIGNKNIIFEGSDDQIYFHWTYLAIVGKQPNDTCYLTCNSCTNMPSFVEFIHQQITNKSLESDSIICLLDNDQEGREAIKKLYKYKGTDKEKKYIKVVKTKSMYLSDSDDNVDKYPSMIEDLVIPEIFYNAICAFLEQKKNIDISKYTFDCFLAERKKYKQIAIMEYANAHFNQSIFTALSVKNEVAIMYAKLIEAKINNNEIDQYKSNYPKLEQFFKEFEQ